MWWRGHGQGRKASGCEAHLANTGRREVSVGACAATKRLRNVTTYPCAVVSRTYLLSSEKRKVEMGDWPACTNRGREGIWKVTDCKEVARPVGGIAGTEPHRQGSLTVVKHPAHRQCHSRWATWPPGATANELKLLPPNQTTERGRMAINISIKNKHAATGMDLEITVLSAVSQKEKERHHMVPLICGI